FCPAVEDGLLIDGEGLRPSSLAGEGGGESVGGGGKGRRSMRQPPRSDGEVLAPQEGATVDGEPGRLDQCGGRSVAVTRGDAMPGDALQLGVVRRTGRQGLGGA